MNESTRMETKIPDITVDGIISKIREKIGRQATQNPPPPSTEVPATPVLQRINWEQIDRTVTNVTNRSRVWTTTPQMEHYSGIVKSIATVIGKITLYFMQVFTKHQEAYNIAVLQSLHAMTDGFRVIEGNLHSLETTVNQLHTRTMTEMQNRFQQVNSEMNSRMDRLSAAESVLEKKISEIDAHRENDATENANKFRMADEVQQSLNKKLTDLENVTTATNKQVRLIENIEEKFVAFVSENLKTIATIDARIAGAHQRIEELQKYGPIVDDISRKTITLMDLEKRIEEQIKDIDTQLLRMATIEQNVAVNTARLDKKAQLWPRVEAIQDMLAKLRAAIQGQEARLATLLMEARSRLPEPFEQEQLEVFSTELKKIDDELYLAFEDKFRGTHEEIMNRVRVYLPTIQNAGAGTKEYPVIDIGCGRGEWLQLLKNENFIAYGVDLNETMVEQCKNGGLKVTHADALEFLHNVHDVSVGAVTGFHIIEHLPTEVWRSVFREAYRVLKPGGVIIFETPNPENLIVGANTFYYDPTHLNPLPSPLVQFVAEQCGFTVEVLKLHPFEDVNFIRENTEVAGRVNHYFYGPRDYAVIGWKK
jgi:SAM-dependent methyltransferase